MSEDPFGFRAAARKTSGDLDIELFAPRPRPTDHDAVRAAREVAQDAGFTRRTPAPAPAQTTPRELFLQSSPTADADPLRASWQAYEGGPAKRVKSAKRRVNIADLLGIQDRYPTAERAQLNMLAPVPVVLRWRKLVAERQLPAWETLEAAMNALEAKSRASRGPPEE